MRLNPYISLSFDGRCEAAFKFYERCLGGKLAFMLTWGNSPLAKDTPPEWGAKTVRMPLQETFWALRYGGVTDQFGIPWEIHCEKPQ